MSGSNPKQTYSNHRHLVPSFHFLTLGAIVALIAGSIVLLLNPAYSIYLPGALLLLTSLVIASVALHCRLFALRVQDRAIRAEENLRYFMLTGQRLNQQITMSQIIALRFASDEEFVQLAKQAADENLSQNKIKKLIKNWRADFHRA